MRPSRASRPAFFSAAATPRSRSKATALSRSPPVSSSARLQSMKPAPVRSRSSLTSPAEISAMLVRYSCGVPAGHGRRAWGRVSGRCPASGRRRGGCRRVLGGSRRLRGRARRRRPRALPLPRLRPRPPRPVRRGRRAAAHPPRPRRARRSGLRRRRTPRPARRRHPVPRPPRAWTIASITSGSRSARTARSLAPSIAASATSEQSSRIERMASSLAGMM